MSLFANRFAGRSAIITGGASGLGLEAARRIAAEGGRVALWDLNPDTLAQAAKDGGDDEDFPHPGVLAAIDLNQGEIRWRVPLGNWPGMKEGEVPSGAQNFGGSIVTAGGLIFIGSTTDEKFRAFDKSTGELLWETTLPFSGNATPATYAINGRQYVVIAAGGGKDSLSGSGGIYVAFALP